MTRHSTLSRVKDLEGEVVAVNETAELAPETVIWRHNAKNLDHVTLYHHLLIVPVVGARLYYSLQCYHIINQDS